MRQVLVAGGLDPTGGAGITADVLHLADLGLYGLPVATCTTVQTTERFVGLEAVSPGVLEGMLAAAFGSGRVSAVKTGLFADAEQVALLGGALAGRNVLLVVDPVQTPSAAAPHTMERRDEVLQAIRRTLVPHATCITPNLAELEVLTGDTVHDIDSAETAAMRLVSEGAHSVLVTGVVQGDAVVDLLVASDGTTMFAHERDARAVHGTGCALASRLAGHLANGLPVARAAALAVADLERLRKDAVAAPGQALMAPFPLVASGDTTVRALEAALPEILALLPGQWVAECGGNVAYAPNGAERESEVAALVGRIRLLDGRAHAPPAARLGASGHVARVALAAASVTGQSAAAVNLRYEPTLLAAAERCGFSVGSFLRSEEPTDATSSVEWGTRSVFQRGAVDLVADPGAPGKEPMVRLIAENPAALIVKLERLVFASLPEGTPLVATAGAAGSA